MNDQKATELDMAHNLRIQQVNERDERIAALESEVAALRAQLAARDQDAELKRATEYACEHLPEWCEVTLFMERHAGWISWSDQHGNEYDVEPNDDSIAKQIIRAVDAARKEQSNG